MLCQELVGILREVEELGLADLAFHHIVLDQFPVSFPDAPHPRLRATVVDAVERVTDRFPFAHEDRFETETLVRRRSRDPREVAEGREGVEEIEVPLGTGSGLDSRAFHQIRHAPRVLVEVLFPHQSMTTDRDAVVGGVEDVGVLQLAHRLETVKDATDLDIDVFDAGIFPSDFIPDRDRVAILPNAAHRDLVTQVGVSVMKGILR